MNPKKQKEKDRRRARKLADEAWGAAEADNLTLAEKIIRRAVAAQPDNPVIWTDQGQILALRHNEAEAAESFRTALSFAPNYAEAYACLATMRVRQGYAREAVSLQQQAVKHAPNNQAYVERLEAYRVLAGEENPVAASKPETVEPGPGAPQQAADQQCGPWPERLATVDWQKTEEQLTREGYALLPSLADAAMCERVCRMFRENALFAKTVVMDRPEFGLGEYRYFRTPVPDIVQQLRRAVYPHVARIANNWQEMLNEPERYPGEWDDFCDDCRSAGQSTPTPIILKYGPGGFNALHRDLRGRVFFPIQMAVVLSPRSDEVSTTPGFRGGEFLFCDVPEGKKSRRRNIPADLGDAVLFCTRDRLVAVGGAYGLQPVKHGVAMITAGERFVLGVPFHEYR